MFHSSQFSILINLTFAISHFNLNHALVILDHATCHPEPTACHPELDSGSIRPPPTQLPSTIYQLLNPLNFIAH